jgi:SpoIID/LytB domain protein
VDFQQPQHAVAGTNAEPYLRGIYDGDGVAPDLTTEEGIDAFYKNPVVPTNFDECGRTPNTRSRWKVTFTAAQLRARLGLAAGVNVSDIQILRRMPSGRAVEVRFVLTSGSTQTFRGWDSLRNVFRPAVATPTLCNPNVTIPAGTVLNAPSSLDITRNADGTLNSIAVYGGGWGHNVGMSQYGAHGRGRAGQTFLQILKAYYTGIDVGSYPIDIGRQPGSGAPLLRQQFYSPGGAATLYVRNADIKKLRVHVNETYDISLDEEELSDGFAAVDLSGLVLPGLNTIQYNTAGSGSATVHVVIE